MERACVHGKLYVECKSMMDTWNKITSKQKIGMNNIRHERACQISYHNEAARKRPSPIRGTHHMSSRKRDLPRGAESSRGMSGISVSML